MRSFWLALTFLTRVPTPASQQFEPADLARATRWYPVVGVAVGLVQIAALTSGTWAVTPLFGAMLAVAARKWFTRAACISTGSRIVSTGCWSTAIESVVWP